MTIRTLTKVNNSAPGASSVVTASLTPTDGMSYLVIVAQVRGASTDPGTITVTGWSQTWTDDSANSGSLWTASGTTRRRVSTAYCQVSGNPSAGSLTFSYTGQPDVLDYTVVELGYTSPRVVVPSSQVKSQTTHATTTLVELTSPTPGSINNRIIGFETGNLQATTLRMELDADTGGEADWHSENWNATGNARARGHTVGWYDGNPNNDTTPGFYQSTGSMVSYRFALEVEMDAAALGVWGIPAMI